MEMGRGERKCDERSGWYEEGERFDAVVIPYVVMRPLWRHPFRWRNDPASTSLRGSTVYEKRFATRGFNALLGVWSARHEIGTR